MIYGSYKILAHQFMSYILFLTVCPLILTLFFKIITKIPYPKYYETNVISIVLVFRCLLLLTIILLFFFLGVNIGVALFCGILYIPLKIKFKKIIQIEKQFFDRAILENLFVLFYSLIIYFSFFINVFITSPERF